jgi:hypothetical protein
MNQYSAAVALRKYNGTNGYLFSGQPSALLDLLIKLSMHYDSALITDASEMIMIDELLSFTVIQQIKSLREE